MTDMASEPESAADAFNALRTEVAVGLRRIDLVLHELTEPALDDEGEDVLDRIAGQIIATHSMVEEIARSPMLQPRTGLRSHPAAVPDEAQAVIQAVERLYRRARSARDQRRALIWASAGGIALGAILWATCAGPLASIAPTKWHWPERMAARTLRADLPDAGVRLLRAADPSLAQDLVTGVDIVAANRAAVERCLAQADRGRRAQACILSVGPR